MAETKRSKKEIAATFPIQRSPQRDVDQALASLEKALGGRSQILSTLVQADLTDDEQLICDLLADPQNDNRSLAKVCGIAHYSLSRLLDLFKKAKGAEAYIKSVNRVYEKLPDIAGDIAERSVPQKARCGDCRGIGLVKRVDVDDDGKPKFSEDGKRVWIEEQCWPCEGTGQITILPDLERQKLALQIGGLIKEKGPAVIVDQRNQLAFSRTNSDFRSATDALLFGRKTPEAQPEAQVVDAEVVQPSEPKESVS